jgi:hypothetical protein
MMALRGGNRSLDRLALDLREKTGTVTNRADVIRALIDGAIDAFLEGVQPSGEVTIMPELGLI